MASPKKTFHFRAVLSDVDHLLVKTAIFLPQHVIDELPNGRVRVKGAFNGVTFALAVQHMKDGSRYFSVSASLRKAAGIKVGNRVQVHFELVDPDKVDIPEELEAVLAEDAEARKAWDQLTRGYQRSLVHYISAVKNVDSRIKRSFDLLNRAKAGLLHGQKK